VFSGFPLGWLLCRHVVIAEGETPLLTRGPYKEAVFHA
jgi:hypothetical protein